MIEEPLWLNEKSVLALYEQLIERFGGSRGLRDRGLMSSALDSPKNHFHYGTSDIFLLAAHYAQAFSRNHPFIDGNKRIALTCAGVFLKWNGCRVKLPEDEAVNMTVKLATKEVTEHEYADWLRKNSKLRAG